MFWGSQDGDLEHGKGSQHGVKDERGKSNGERRDSKGRLLPNPVLCCESLSVRATAQALLTYSLRREFIIEPIARWINSRRRSPTSWSARSAAVSWDTALAVQALVAHSLANSGETRTSLAITVRMRSSKSNSAFKVAAF